VIPPLAPTFEAALRDVYAQQTRFREAAAARLSEPPVDRRDEAVGGLLALSSDPNGDVRAAAFESLGMLEAAEGRQAALDAFDDEHPPARQAAVLALGRIDPERGATHVAPLLTDRRPDMRFSAVWTLSLLGAEHAPAIARALNDEDPEVRLLSTRCLADLDAVSHADAVARLLSDSHDEVRFGAAAALATLGDGRGATALRAALRHPDRAFVAAVGLGDLEDQSSHDDLSALARHPLRAPIVRAAAARALVKIGDPRGTMVLRKLVRSWRIEARQYAIELVGELGLVSLVPDLERAFRRSSRSERAVYETTLEQLLPKSSEARALLASIRRNDQAK
jgi:HEAT repeat protein